MSDTLRVACVQLTSRDDKAANIEKAEQLVARAAATGADVVVLPEKWARDQRPRLLAQAGARGRRESVRAMAAWASGRRITLVGGSIWAPGGRDELSTRASSSSRTGRSPASTGRSCSMSKSATRYYRESDAEEPGDEPVVVDAEGWPTGLTVCYDVPLPRLYRILALQGHLPRHGSGAFHALHRQGSLGAAAPRPCRHEDRTTSRPPPRSARRCRAASATAVRSSRIPGERWSPWPDEETVISAGSTGGSDVRAKLPSLASRQADAYRWPTPTP